MRHANSLFATLLLLLAADRVGAQPYDLRGPTPKQGTIVQTRVEMSMPEGTLTIEAGGTVTRTKAAIEDVSTSELEVVQTDGRQLNMLRYRVAEAWTKTSLKNDGAAPQETIDDGPLVGETVLIERQAEGFKKAMLGREPDERQRAWLREPFTEAAELYPAKPVALGESWVLEGARLATFFGFTNALAADGKATFTLERVSTEGGDRRAIISYRLELRGKMLDENNSLVDFTLGGSGKIHRSLGSYLDVSTQLTGQQHFAGSVTENGQKSTVTVAGPIEVKTSERLVTSGSRAEVVRRAAGTRPSQAVTAGTPPPERPAEPPVAQRPFWNAQATRSCQGTALACWQRNAFNCSHGSGCTATGACSGVAVETCFGKPQFSCGSTPGCFWQSWSRSCGGTITCWGKNAFACGSTRGCSWLSSCQGAATPCSTLGEGECFLQPGCSFK